MLCCFDFFGCQTNIWFVLYGLQREFKDKQHRIWFCNWDADVDVGITGPIFGAIADKYGGHIAIIGAFIFYTLGVYFLYTGPTVSYTHLTLPTKVRV